MDLAQLSCLGTLEWVLLIKTYKIIKKRNTIDVRNS